MIFGRVIRREYRQTRNRREEACSRADSASDIRPKTRARAHYDLGMALGYSGRYDEGIREIEKANGMFPEDLFFAEIRKIRGFRQDAERLRTQEEESSFSRDAPDGPLTRVE